MKTKLIINLLPIMFLFGCSYQIQPDKEVSSVSGEYDTESKLACRESILDEVMKCATIKGKKIVRREGSASYRCERILRDYRLGKYQSSCNSI